MGERRVECEYCLIQTLARATLGNFQYVMPVLVSILLVGSLNSSLFAASR